MQEPGELRRRRSEWPQGMPLCLAMNMTASADPNFTSSFAASILWQSSAPSISPLMTSVKNSRMSRPLSVTSRTSSAMVGGLGACDSVVSAWVSLVWYIRAIMWRVVGGCQGGDFTTEDTEGTEGGVMGRGGLSETVILGIRDDWDDWEPGSPPHPSLLPQGEKGPEGEPPPVAPWVPARGLERRVWAGLGKVPRGSGRHGRVRERRAEKGTKKGPEAAGGGGLP